MAERALRGLRLGGQSFEDERGIEFAARQEITYVCVSGHSFVRVFADDAEIPPTWECPRCGAEAATDAVSQPQAGEPEHVRTHWDMLLERRTRPELEEILADRLALLRAGQIGPAHLHRANQKAARQEAGRGAAHAPAKRAAAKGVTKKAGA